MAHSLSKQAAELLVAARGSRERKWLATKGGITGEALSHIERGTQNPTLSRLERLGELYGVRFVLSTIPLEDPTHGTQNEKA